MDLNRLHENPNAVDLIVLLRQIQGTLSPVLHEVLVPLGSPEPWSKYQYRYWTPRLVDTVCPHCNKTSGLDLTNNGVQVVGGTTVIPASGRCVQCNGVSSVWIINPRNIDESTGCESIWMLPIPHKKTIRHPIPLPPSVPPDVRIFYKAAIDCFNAGIWDVCVRECGRTMDMTALDRVSGIKDLRWFCAVSRGETDPEVMPLFKPILNLALLLKTKGENAVTSRFRDVEDAGEELADQALTMVEYFMEYLYTLDQRTETLFNALNTQETGSLDQ